MATRTLRSVKSRSWILESNAKRDRAHKKEMRRLKAEREEKRKDRKARMATLLSKIDKK